MSTSLTRRTFLALSSALPWALSRMAEASPKSKVPVGLELYSVREHLKQDPQGTVRAVAAMGYQCVEFYAPYFEWTEKDAKQMRSLLDELGIHYYSTHNDASYFETEKLRHAQELNQILGSKYVIMAHNDADSEDKWKAVADKLNAAAEQLGPAGIRTGYHNHQKEFRADGGRRPMEILAANTKKTVALQLDVGTCVEAGSDPAAWIRSQPGRVKSIHCKDWSRDTGYKVILGQGSADWKKIFAAAESVGGTEYYLIEQEEGGTGELETVKRCLEAYRALRKG